MTENDLKNAIIQYLRLHGWLVFRINSGAATVKGLGIAILPKICYYKSAETNGARGVLLLNAVNHNTFIVGKAPLMCGFTSRHSSQQRWQAHKGRFVMSKEDEAKEKKREYQRRYREANREKKMEYLRKWREANPEYNSQYHQAHREEILERQRGYRKENPEKVTQATLRWREENQERVRERRLQYYRENLEEQRERNRRYQKAKQKEIATRVRLYRGAHPEINRVLNRRRRVRKIGASGSHTEAEWQALCSYYMDQCLCCGEVPDLLTCDHIVPLSEGGSDDISNIQPLCQSCNSRKGTRTIDYRNV